MLAATMLRTFSFIFLVAIATSVQSAECTARKPENFADFFKKFADSKQFAASRTNYPLKIVTQSYGTDAQGHDITGASVELRSMQDDDKNESLSAEMKKNNMSYRILSVRKRSAVVNVYVEGTGWAYNHHFTQKGNCWFQTKIEDYSQ